MSHPQMYKFPPPPVSYLNPDAWLRLLQQSVKEQQQQQSRAGQSMHSMPVLAMIWDVTRSPWTCNPSRSNSSCIDKVEGYSMSERPVSNCRAGHLLEACVGSTKTGQGASSTNWELTPPIGDRAFLKRPLTVLVTTSRSIDCSSQKSQICALASPCRLTHHVSMAITR